MYSVNEVFYSVQGEGERAGSANVFVRLSGCNLRCDIEAGERSPGGFACDTEFVSGRALSGAALLNEVERVVGKVRQRPGVIFTGGEPALQLKPDLVANLKAHGYAPICIETNGTVDVEPLGLDWVSCSPKVAEHALKLRRADELRYVRHYGQGVPQPSIAAAHHFLSPAFDGDQLDPQTLRWCIELVKQNPTWRLSVQQHKVWRVR